MNRAVAYRYRNGSTETGTMSDEVFKKHKAKCFSSYNPAGYEQGQLHVHLEPSDYPNYKYYEVCDGCGHKALTNHLLVSLMESSAEPITP